MTQSDPCTPPVKGRGATFNPANRFRANARKRYDDGWPAQPEADDELPPLRTTVTIQRARTIIARNDSPDIPFTQSINPYQGCEHGCVYCYARPSHAYLDLSPGLDFETKLFAKPDAAALLRAELAKPGYRCEPIALGANTDPYQPIEREWKVTRSDDRSARRASASAHDHDQVRARRARPRHHRADGRAAAGARLRVDDHARSRACTEARAARSRAASAAATVKTLSADRLPVGVMVAPIIPQLNDRDLEAILDAAAADGAGRPAG